MSWKDNIENIELTIVTGDNEVFKPLYTTSSQDIEFNVSEFNFIELEGTLVTRKKVKSQKIPLNIIFQGDDHIDIAEKFLESSKDPRYWTVTHPIIGEIYGHPASISKANDDLNTVVFSIDFWETIRPGEVLSSKVYPLELIESKNIELIEFGSLNLIPDQKPELKSLVSKIESRYDTLINATNIDQFKGLLSNAMSGIDDLLKEPQKAIRNISQLIQFPAYIEGILKNRVKLIQAILNDIKEIFPDNNLNYSIFGGAVVSGIAQIILKPSENDFITRNDVQVQFNNLADVYDNFLNDIDNNNFQQDFQEAITLNEIIINTLYYLYDVSFDAKQERYDIVESDTNLILLTHKYMGLDKEDKNLNTFREINGIKNKNLFIVKKGRKITYLV